MVDVDTKEIGGLFRQVLNEIIVFAAHFNFQPKFIENGAVAKVMVQVTMSGNEVNRAKVSLPDIVDNRIILFLIESTAAKGYM